MTAGDLPRAGMAAVLGVLSVSLASCGGAAGTDAGSTEDAGSSLPTEAAETLGAAAPALAIATALTAPLVPSAQGLRDGAPGLDGPGRDARARRDLEAGVSGMSVVEPPTCASYAWMGSEVDVTFTGCTLEATGESLDGSIHAAVSFFPTRFALTFTDLRVGATEVDGMVTLNVGGRCAGTDLGCTPCMGTDLECMAMAEEQTSITGSVTITSGGTTVLALDDVTVTSDPTGVTANGTFTIDGTSVTASSLHWATGECLPSSGTAMLPTPPTTITFLPTTPADGTVQVQVGSFPAFPQMLFMPCGS